MSSRRVPWLLLRVVGTAVGVALIAHSIDAGALARTLTGLDGRWVGVALVLSAASLAGNVASWGVLLRDTGNRLTSTRLTSWYLEGAFVGQAVPEGAI